MLFFFLQLSQLFLFHFCFPFSQFGGRHTLPCNWTAPLEGIKDSVSWNHYKYKWTDIPLKHASIFIHALQQDVGELCTHDGFFYRHCCDVCLVNKYLYLRDQTTNMTSWTCTCTICENTYGVPPINIHVLISFFLSFHKLCKSLILPHWATTV